VPIIYYSGGYTTPNTEGRHMRFDDTRDNTTAIEATIIEADAREDDDGDDIEEDDGQPSEYVEWQDFMGGDDWDHGQFDDCGW